MPLSGAVSKGGDVCVAYMGLGPREKAICVELRGCIPEPRQWESAPSRHSVPGTVSREQLQPRRESARKSPCPCALPVLCSRYSPHQDADPLKPRVPAIIKHFTAYKNQDHGAWLRGGDVWLDSCR